VIVGGDIFTRSVLNFSFEISDELGGYILAALCFFGLAVTRAHDGFHRVEFVLDRLHLRGRLLAGILFDLVALALALLLAAYLLRYVHATWESGSVAPTRLMTPLWIAQLPLVLGMLAYAFGLIRGLWISSTRFRVARFDGSDR
jgi:TRAP-type C4-dicarboxylate transport system permease small subunit